MICFFIKNFIEKKSDNRAWGRDVAEHVAGKPMTTEYKTRKQRLAESVAAGGPAAPGGGAGVATASGGHLVCVCVRVFVCVVCIMYV
jgi:hypothetical protein